MDDLVRETIVASFSRIVMQRCDHRLVDCAVEHKVGGLYLNTEAFKLWFIMFAAEQRAARFLLS